MDDKRYIAPSTIVQSDTNENESYSIPQIATLIEQRQKFRSTQEWEEADNIRTQLENMGFSVQDSCSGVTSLGKQETKKYVDSKKGDIGADIRRLTKKRNFLQLKHLLETSEEYRNKINDGNINDKTALHIACQWCSTEMVELLIQYGADVNKLASRGQSPLCFAISKKRYSTVKYLLEKCKASCKLKTVLLETPATMAKLTCHDRQDIVNMVIAREKEEDEQGVEWIDYTNNEKAIKFQVQHAINCKNCQAKILIARRNCKEDCISEKSSETTLPWIIDYEKYRLKEEEKMRQYERRKEENKKTENIEAQKLSLIRNKSLNDWLHDTFTSNNTNNVDSSSNKTFFDDSIIRKALVYRMSLTGKAVGRNQKKAYQNLQHEFDTVFQSNNLNDKKRNNILLCEMLQSLNNISSIQETIIAVNELDNKLNACTSVRAARKLQRNILKLIMNYYFNDDLNSKSQVLKYLEEIYLPRFSPEYKKIIEKYIQKDKNKNSTSNNNNNKLKQLGNCEEKMSSNNTPYLTWLHLFPSLSKTYKEISLPKQYTRKFEGIHPTITNFLDLRLIYDNNNENKLDDMVNNTTNNNHIAPNNATAVAINNVFWINTLERMEWMEHYFKKLHDTILNNNFIHVGVDSEFSNSRKDGCAVIQIAVNNIVFCIDTFKISEKLYLKEIQFLKYLFETKVFLKIVFAFRNDWKELYKFSKEMIAKDNCKSFVDIQDVMMNVKLFNDLIEIDNKNQPGLSDVVKIFLKYPLDKREQCSNWETRPLSRLQMIYAAIDAVVLLDVFHAMYLMYV